MEKVERYALERWRKMCLYIVAPYWDTKKNGRLTLTSIADFEWDNFKDERLEQIKQQKKRMLNNPRFPKRIDA